MSASVIGAMRVNLGLDSAKFERGAKRTRSPLDQMKRQILAFAAVATAAGAGLTAFAMKGADQIDRLAKSARRVDSSIGGFRALELSAGEAGVSVDTLTDAVQTMDREIAKGSKNAATALRTLGLSAKDLEGLEADQKMALLADRIKEAGLSTADTSVLLQQLGIRNREMVLALGAGGEVFRSARKDIEDYGLAVSKVDSDRIEAANDAIGRLGLIGQYASQQLALALVPALGQMAQAMTDSLREGGLLRQMIDGFVGNLDAMAFALAAASSVLVGRYVAALTLSTAALVAKTLAAGVATSAMRALGLAVAFAGGPLGAVAALLGAGAAAAVIFGRDAQAAGDAMSEAERAAALLGTELGILSGNDLPVATAKTVDLANANLTLARSAYAAAQAQNELAIANLAAADQQLGNEAFSGIESDLLPGQAARNRAINDLRAAQDELRQSEEELNARVLEGNKVKADASQVVRDLNVNVRGLEDAAGGASRGLKQTTDDVKKLTDAQKELEQAADMVENSFESAFTGFITGATSARKAAGQLLASLAQMAASAAFRGMFGGSKGFDIIGSLFGSVGARAAGGPVQRGSPYLVNENTPRSEIFVPSTSGAVLNVSQAQAALQGASSGPTQIHLIARSDPGVILEIAQNTAVQVTREGIQQFSGEPLTQAMRANSADQRLVRS